MNKEIPLSTVMLSIGGYAVIGAICAYVYYAVSELVAFRRGYSTKDTEPIAMLLACLWPAAFPGWLTWVALEWAHISFDNWRLARSKNNG